MNGIAPGFWPWLRTRSGRFGHFVRWAHWAIKLREWPPYSVGYVGDPRDIALTPDEIAYAKLLSVARDALK